MPAKGWSRKFDDPIPVAKGKESGSWRGIA
jgi:hypothetical protein